ncbi:MAG: GNAT family N-acetyltransferase [Chitinophagales bacterium]
MDKALSAITMNYNGYIITTDKSLMKVNDVHKWLSEVAYWCLGIPFETFKTAFDNSFCIGALSGDRQIGYGRLVTDYATFAYLADVYVEEAHRGKGISKKMMQVLFDLDWVKGLRSIKLATRDAHELYKKFGFTPLKNPERYMQILRAGIYEDQKGNSISEADKITK